MPQDSGEAVQKAYQTRFPRLITENLDSEFKKAQLSKQDPYSYMDAVPNGGGVKKYSTVQTSSSGMKRSASSFTVDRVFDVPHNPFRTRMAIETPQNLIELYQRFRFYYQREPLVGTACELHSEFPMSTFEVTHDDPFLAEFFNDMVYDLNLFDLLLDMSLEYYIIGECFPFGILDDPNKPERWTNFILLNPLNVDIATAPITDGKQSHVYKLKIDEVTKDIIKKGPNDPTTGTLYNRIPQDIKDSCKKDGYIALPDIQVSHFKKKGNYFKTRGESMLYRIMHLLSYRDKLRDSQYSIADRNCTPREIYKLGETTSPASEEELSAFAAMLSNTYLDPSQAIVWAHALQVDVIGGGDKVLPLRQELDGVEEEMLTGLYLNKGFLDSSYGAYANMSVALDVLISRYIVLRQRIERWLKDHVFAPICRIHDLYKPSQAELSHKIKIKNANKRPWTPDVHWEKHELRDNTQKVNLLLTLRDKLGKPGFPRGPILQSMNYNPKTISKQLAQEAKEDVINNRSQVDLKGGAPGGGLGGPGGPLGDLGVDSTSLGAPLGGAGGGDAGKLNVDPSKLPEYGGAADVANINETKPPASNSIQNDQTPTNVG